MVARPEASRPAPQKPVQQISGACSSDIYLGNNPGENPE